MNPPLIAAEVANRLDERGTAWMLTGALPLMVYGHIRSTTDVDVVINGGPEEATAVIRALGAEFKLDPQTRFETLTGSTRQIAAHVPSGCLVEFFFLGADAHHQARFSRRRNLHVPIMERTAWVPTAEDIVIQKLRWGRNKDIADVEGLLFLQHDQLDWDWLKHWTSLHGTEIELQAILDRVHKS